MNKNEQNNEALDVYAKYEDMMQDGAEAMNNWIMANKPSPAKLQAYLVGVNQACMALYATFEETKQSF